MSSVLRGRDAVLDLRPMLATPGLLPQSHGYAYEFKWDGMRALVHCTSRDVRIVSRNGNEVTHRFPELHGLAQAVGRPAILDGEIVALDAKGRPDFGLLQGRFGLEGEADIRAQMRAAPVDYLAFDLLMLDGKDLTGQPYARRRAALESLRLQGDHWSTPPSQPDAGPAMMEASRTLGLEGTVAKLLDSPYRPGQRSPAWVKVRNRMRQEFVVGGWTEGEGARRGQVGSLLLGFYGSREDPDRLVYAGRCGSGFTGQSMERVQRALAGLATERPCFDSTVEEDAGDAHWVRPELVAEVEFSGLTQHRVLRQASFKGLRADKIPRQVVWEQPEVNPWHAQSGADRSALAS